MKWGEPWIVKREKYRVPQGCAWVDWFAWYPVHLDRETGAWAWLETVQYRRFDGMSYNLPEYREKPCVAVTSHNSTDGK